MNQKLYPQADKVGPLETGGKVVVVTPDSQASLGVILSQLFNGLLVPTPFHLQDGGGSLAPPSGL